MFFNYFKKITKNKNSILCGINFDQDNNFQIIELQKINNSFVPIFYKKYSINNKNQKKESRKEQLVTILKQYKKKIKSDNIRVFSENQNKVNILDISSALKISGFKKVEFVREKNILGIIFNAYTPYQRFVFYFTKKRIYIFETDEFLLKNIEEIENKDFEYQDIKKFLKNLKTNEIFVAGLVNQEKLEELENIFNKKNISVNPINIWSNVLSFYDDIPQMHLLDSYDYIDVLSILVPDLKPWPILGNKKNTDLLALLPKDKNKKEITEVIGNNENKSSKKKKKKKIISKKKNKILFLPKNKSFKTKLKKFFNTEI